MVFLDAHWAENFVGIDKACLDQIRRVLRRYADHPVVGQDWRLDWTLTRSLLDPTSEHLVRARRLSLAKPPKSKPDFRFRVRFDTLQLCCFVLESDNLTLLLDVHDDRLSERQDFLGVLQDPDKVRL
jgi:hypothetical protein